MSNFPHTKHVTRGECPKCHRRYLIKDNGYIRKHNGPFAECFTADQLPYEALHSGTCYRCGRKIPIKRNGYLRKHYGNKICLTKDQLPAELLASVLLIATLGDTENDTPNNVPGRL